MNRVATSIARVQTPDAIADVLAGRVGALSGRVAYQWLQQMQIDEIVGGPGVGSVCLDYHILEGCRLRAFRPEITGHYRMGVLWSPSYFFAASCGVAPLDIIRKYIEDQRATQKPRLARLRPYYFRPEGRGFTARWITG